MRILLTGGTGLIGRALCQHWHQQGHTLWVWSRNPQQVPSLCSGATGIARLQELDSTVPLDAVVNLAGAPIAERRWTAARRDLLWRSRVELTRTLVEWMGQQASPPHTLLSASAVSWYGNGAETQLDETSPPGSKDFGSLLCMAWEREAERAREWQTRVVVPRIAPVLALQGGMLPRLLPLFRLGLGGQFGNGQQWQPWIHIDDLVRLFDHLLLHAECNGAFNACAPEPLRNRDFTQILAHTLHRPALFPMPAWLLHLTLGEMSNLLLSGQRLQPLKTKQSGFEWRYPTLKQALVQLLQTPSTSSKTHV